MSAAGPNFQRPAVPNVGFGVRVRGFRAFGCCVGVRGGGLQGVEIGLDVFLILPPPSLAESAWVCRISNSWCLLTHSLTQAFLV